MGKKVKEDGSLAPAEMPVFSEAQGEFVLTAKAFRKLLNGNKIHIVLEAEFDIGLSQALEPLCDKDVRVTFQEIASKKHRKEYGDEESQLTLGADGVGPE